MNEIKNFLKEMELFQFFKNDNLRLALYNRMIGNYKLAKKHLLIAAEEDQDGQALFVLAETYGTGGFGIKREYSKCKDLCRRSSEAGCIWGTIKYAPESVKLEDLENDVYAKALYTLLSEKYISDPIMVKALYDNMESNVLICRLLWLRAIYTTDNFIDKITTFGIKISDGLIQNDLDLTLESANQRVDDALVIVAEDYYKAGDYEKSMYYGLKYSVYFSLVFRILQKHPTKKLHFMFGRKVERLNPVNHSDESIQIYRNTIQMCRQATCCFIWIVYKKKRWVSKDIAILIGKMIYASRNDPDLWNIPTKRLVKRNKNI